MAKYWTITAGLAKREFDIVNNRYGRAKPYALHSDAAKALKAFIAEGHGRKRSQYQITPAPDPCVPQAPTVRVRRTGMFGGHFWLTGDVDVFGRMAETTTESRAAQLTNEEADRLIAATLYRPQDFTKVPVAAVAAPEEERATFWHDALSQALPNIPSIDISKLIERSWATAAMLPSEPAQTSTRDRPTHVHIVQWDVAAGHILYWRAEGEGYTNDINEAHLWPIDRALAWVNGDSYTRLSLPDRPVSAEALRTSRGRLFGEQHLDWAIANGVPLPARDMPVSWGYGIPSEFRFIDLADQPTFVFSIS